MLRVPHCVFLLLSGDGCLIAAPIKGAFPLTPACAFSHTHSGITSNQLQEGWVCVGAVQYLSCQQLKFNYHASKAPFV